MNASGFGVFVPFGEMCTGTLFLDGAPGGVNDTAILFKVSDREGRDRVVRIFDPAAIDRGCQMPGLAPVPAPGHPVLALADCGVEVESSVDNVVWEQAVDFVRAVVVAGVDGRLCLKAYRGREGAECDCQLFDLTFGVAVDLGQEVVGFRRWAIVRRTAQGERVDLYRFEA